MGSFVSLIFVTSSLFFFIGKNLLFSGWTAANASITPLRWVSATVVPVIVVSWGHQRQSLSISGSLLALIVGFTLSLAHYSFFMSLIVFFLSSNKATKFKQEVKKTFESDFKEGGQRSWLQVLCNGAMATELALLYLLDVGSADLPVDFRNQYRASWLGMGVLGAVACCNGDTWASELGSVIATADPFLITTFQKVPKGTNGGVTVVGLISSLLGGLVIGVAYYMGIFYGGFSGGYGDRTMPTTCDIGRRSGRPLGISLGLADWRNPSVFWQGHQDRQDRGGRQGGGRADLWQDGAGQPQRQPDLQHPHCVDLA